MNIRKFLEKNFRRFSALLGVSKAPPTTDDGVIVPPPAPGVNRLSVPLNKEE
ncbi:hypothetical protein [Paenibacillus sp. ICGEB2008]|nr:hypothetical protein [Paenibacillus sp. ICGEB2008]